MTYGCIEDLKFAIEVFDRGGDLREVLAGDPKRPRH